MEKTNLGTALTERRSVQLVREIVKGVRKTAQEIPVFAESHNGCIRITVVPLCWEADVWLGGMSEIDDDGRITDVNEYEYVRAIFPGGSHTIDYVCEDGRTELVNCYAYSALKTAYLSRLRQLGITREESAACGLDDFIEENGWSVHEGSIVATMRYHGSPVMRFYVCVSGAKSAEDLQCAFAGLVSGGMYLCTGHAGVQLSIFDGGRTEREWTLDES